MHQSVYIDPQINLDSNAMIEVIVQFITNPAKSQMALNPENRTWEEADQQVKESHLRFQMDILKYLDRPQLPYVVMHRYQDAFNGVAMKIRGMDIRSLLHSNEVSAIYLNKTASIPIKPSDPKYQL